MSGCYYYYSNSNSNNLTPSSRAWKEADALADARWWGEAGAGFAAIAEKAVRVKDRRLAREAASRAADAFRRDDRPAAAAKMLRLAFQNGQDGLNDRVQLAAVLLDAGQIEAAFDIVATAADTASDPAEKILALDTRVGLALARGRVADARQDLAAIERFALPGAEIAAGFRQAQLDRLDGLLSRAEAGWRQLVDVLTPHAQAAGPLGAAYAELGETAALRQALGADVDPEPFFVAAVEAWTRAGRRSGVFRAEAWLLRVRRGLPTAIDRAITYAMDRGMPLLAAELYVCRAVCKQDPVDAFEAVRIATEAPFARGRARVIAVELGGAADLSLAHSELREDAAWTARALLADPATAAEGRMRAEALLA